MVSRIVWGSVSIVVFFVLVFIGCETITTVGADEIVVKQNAWDGKLNYWTQPGVYNKMFGRTTRYRKSTQYSFSSMHDQGKKDDQSLKARFNDGGHGYISGTLRFELPLTEAHLMLLHTKFGSQEAIEQQLVRPVVERAVFMSGPLMSSKESAAERRSDLIQYIEDQVAYGVYRYETEEQKTKDSITGQERTVTRVKLVKDEKQPNGFARQEISPLRDFGVRTYSFNINGIKYDADVEKQITQQQSLIMQVQTAIANAKRAEQDSITAAKDGEARAMKAKWDQEVKKATAVTEAEQKVEVAKREVQTAELYKQQQTLMGEGEAARRRAAMSADGALEKKLNAYVEVQKAWAAEVGKQRWVPEVMIGGGGNQTGLNIMDILGVKAARDLALDMQIKGAVRPAPAPAKGAVQPAAAKAK